MAAGFAHRLFRSLDRGNNLQAISPEITLTKRGSGTAFAESPRNPNILYAGTDDGALWVTRDGGHEWKDITKNLGIRDPRWELNRLSIEPDPRARFYDPDCPDHPPMPPDDPTSHEIMHCVDCKAGWPCWHRNGEKPIVENVNFLDYLPYDERGCVVLNREAAVQIALVNSPNYQTNLEELYLSALEVTQQRFAFDMQFFATNQTFFTTQGRVRGGGSEQDGGNQQARKPFHLNSLRSDTPASTRS